ncbi:beta-1,3-galactosyltransferase pvg3 [Lactuca sativa]|uniref:beta-1,3-galactosyltransferase pvg3 n=1 Tax=Lactuca sativa TaxID=4236 RepID=UPI000CA78F88|nr:beta-1,3-galactosyltransferase pvg3 [Lactuca sativa]
MNLKVSIHSSYMVCSEKPMLKMNHKRFLFTKLPLMTSVVLMVIFIIFNLYIKNPFQHSSNVQNYPSTKRFSLLIGILTRADKHEHRHFLRLIYGIQSSPLAQIDLKFVFCNLTKQEQRVLISFEILKFNDIIILNCSENMNDGKTYTYFSSLPNILSHPYDYVMKADDDVYFRLLPLASSLQPLPRSDLYYGFVIPCQSMNPFVSYMSGMGFVLSWDLVEWIANSDIPRNDTIGPEDKLVGKWLNLGKKARNRVSNKPAMYDYPGMNGRCSHELIPETIAVHKLKRWDQWLDVIRYFNVTKDLNTSKLYNGLNVDSVFNLKM